MSAFAYRIFTEWSAEDGAYVARVPALGPGVAAHGDTPGDATQEAQEAALAVLEVIKKQGKPVPTSDLASDFSGQFILRIPRSLHRALALESEADETSLNQAVAARLAASLGWTAGRRGKGSRETPAKLARKAGGKKRR